ncbi:uncharacterized protein E0L32_002130 [Thyridium curvatum]|uniref:Heterokaryon incompatibility domain-containing protein n=1 Tax=Thyridium curvatum TaxID=1093900 RepID=A0A507AKJ8_9PEZI|nr:uncharacterized protein E0L32_002003 [Thyridium curvatum]XP_030989238.1 uncharacterized protein E0L32_002130 [Thyridium curvatum]TPX07400.1 hypothetical protein E0L32_002003 [Thyridium curvatum]TPX07527.1 hypothetical protein E0L32_002130 [Thyridium curvatum]
MVSHGDLRVRLDIKSVDESWARFFEDNEGPDSTTGSARALNLSKRWLQICPAGREHNECQEANDDRQERKILPRRLVHVGAPDSEPRIVEVHDTPVPYCVLSYCSSSKDSLTTTGDNLQRHMAGIPPDNLPILMQDAVHVTRSLGFEHLCTDVLCIVQDDEDDRAHEAAVMDAIYSNAELTISALVLGDCHTSLFTPRSGRIVLPVPLPIWTPKPQRAPHRCRVVCTEWLQRDVDLPDSVLSQGWAFQEQLLSKRILHFGDGILYWECLHHYTIGADPGGEDGRIWRNRIRRHDTKLAIHAPASIGADPELKPKRFYQEPFEIWKKQVEGFTKRDLEKPHDKLPVIAAVSTRLAAAAHSSILCGIWNGDQLLESLC